MGVAVAASMAGAAETSPAVKTMTDAIRIPGTVVEFKLVKLPAGKVTIKDKDGNDKEVEVKPVWIGQTEVTWPEYDVYWQAMDLPEAERKAVLDKKGESRPSLPYLGQDRDWGHEGWPAGSMFCKEAKRYCEWLSKMTGHKYRLPTEAEWEYACRAGGPPVKPEKDQLKEVAWFELNSEDQAHAVAKKQPNAWGLYDMLGNVAEWVIRLDGSEAVAGGSFQDEEENVHSGAREPFSERWQRDDPQTPKGASWLSNGGHVGFRVVREE
jgi:formylglycine-generating enzyme required for sulfatase activity